VILSVTVGEIFIMILYAMLHKNIRAVRTKGWFALTTSPQEGLEVL